MATITINITDEEEKLLLTEISDIHGWTENFLKVKISKVRDRTIEEYTEFNPKKISLDKKIELTSKMKLEKGKDVRAGRALGANLT